MTTIVAISGSSRRASFNRRLLDLAAVRLEAGGATIDLVGAEILEVPIYNGDDQDATGIPAVITELHDRIATSEGLLVASPEYNGAFSPLLKNTFDWVSRVEMGVFRTSLIGLMATSPGRRGGVHGMGMLAKVFDYLGATVHEPHFSLPSAGHSFTEDGLVDDEATRLSTWAADYLTAVGASADLAATDGAG